MVDIAFYLVSEAVARRSGVIQSRYRTADGRFILDTKDLSNIRLTSEEFINGLDDVEMVSKQDAMILIKANGYQMGLPVNVASQSVVTEENEQKADGEQSPATYEEPETVQVETESGEILDEQTISSGDVGNVEDILGDILGGGTQQDKDEQPEVGIPISEESETKTEEEAPAKEENNNESNKQKK